MNCAAREVEPHPNEILSSAGKISRWANVPILARPRKVCIISFVKGASASFSFVDFYGELFRYICYSLSGAKGLQLNQ